MCAYDLINNNVLIIIQKADFIFYLKQRTNGRRQILFSRAASNRNDNIEWHNVPESSFGLVLDSTDLSFPEGA